MAHAPRICTVSGTDVIIPLTRGMTAIADAELFESDLLYTSFAGQQSIIRPSAITWSAIKSRHQFYAGNGATKPGPLMLHRVLSQAPAGILVDHRDRDSLNNRLTNLRLCNHSQNMANAPPRPGTSRFKGVYASRRTKPWRVTLAFTENGRLIKQEIGHFHSEIEAARAYDEAALQRYGEFAFLNESLIQAELQNVG